MSNTIVDEESEVMRKMAEEICKEIDEERIDIMRQWLVPLGAPDNPIELLKAYEELYKKKAPPWPGRK